MVALETLIPALPMPWLALQFGLAVTWIVGVAFAVRRWGRRGYFTILSAPLLVVSWWLVVLVAYVQGCVRLSGAGC